MNGRVQLLPTLLACFDATREGSVPSHLCLTCSTRKHEKGTSLLFPPFQHNTMRLNANGEGFILPCSFLTPFDVVTSTPPTRSPLPTPTPPMPTPPHYHHYHHHCQRQCPH